MVIHSTFSADTVGWVPGRASSL